MISYEIVMVRNFTAVQDGERVQRYYKIGKIECRNVEECREILSALESLGPEVQCERLTVIPSRHGYIRLTEEQVEAVVDAYQEMQDAGVHEAKMARDERVKIGPKSKIEHHDNEA